MPSQMTNTPNDDTVEYRVQPSDPTFAVPDYDTQKKLRARRRAAADAMVSDAQARIDAGANGRMVGPYWIAHDDRNDLLKQATGAGLGYINDKEEESEAKQLADIRQQLLARMPSATVKGVTIPAGNNPDEEGTYQAPDTLKDPRTYSDEVGRWATKATGVPGMEGYVKEAQQEIFAAPRRQAEQADAAANRQLTLRQQIEAAAERQRQHNELLASNAALAAAQREADRKSREQVAADNRADRQAARAEKAAAEKPAKPLPPYMAKDVAELQSNKQTLSRLESGFKDDYAGDTRSSIERAAGQVLGGAAPQSTQDMTRWWADQAFFDELPQRHALFGAALTPTELKSWANAAINPSLSPKTIRERLATRKQIYDEALKRKRDEIEAAGYNVKQFEAMTRDRGASGSFDPPPAAPAAPVQVNSAADYAKLPSGAKYIDPQGNRRTKP